MGRYAYLGGSFTTSVSIQFGARPVLGVEQTKEGPALSPGGSYPSEREYPEAGAGECRGACPSLWTGTQSFSKTATYLMACVHSNQGQPLLLQP